MEPKKENTANLNYNSSVYWKFILLSLFGVFMFLCPVPYNGAISTPVGVISDVIAKHLNYYLPYIITPLIIISAVMATITLIFKPKSILKNKLLNSFFNISAESSSDVNSRLIFEHLYFLSVPIVLLNSKNVFNS